MTRASSGSGTAQDSGLQVLTSLVAGLLVCQVMVVFFSLMSENDTFWITGGTVSLVRMKVTKPKRHRHKRMAPIDIFCHSPSCIRPCFLVDGLRPLFRVFSTPFSGSAAEG